MENIIIQILSILIQSTFAFYFCISVCNCFKDNISKTKYKGTFIFILLSVIISSVLNLKQYNALLNTIFLATLLVFILKFYIKIPLLKSIITIVSYYILMTITEIISFYILHITLNISGNELSSTSYSFLIFLILQNIFNVLFTLIFNVFIIKKFNLDQIFKTITFKNLKLLLLMIIGYILPQIIIFTFNRYAYPFPLIIINTIQIILVSFLIFLYFRSIINKEKIESELITTETQNKTLIEIVDGIRTLKHDYGNIVQALNGYVITKQYEQLDEYINSLLKEFNSVNSVSSIDPNIFNEPAIYGVVGAKYFFATEHDITFELEITSNIKEINFPKPELSRIFGILLDNAIEATQKAKEKYIKLEIHFDEKKYSDVIRIINTYDQSIDIDLNKIYEKGISSKKIKSGIGLWEVKKIIKRNKNSQIYAEIEKGKFIQNLIIEKAE